MSGYGSHKWTCGECGDSYEASGVVADLTVARWEVEHREQHRIEKMTEEERQKHYDGRARAAMALFGRRGRP
jgi:hypothetical protein